MDAMWYVRRLSRMTPGEAARRLRDADTKRRWRGKADRPIEIADARLGGFAFRNVLPDGRMLARSASEAATARLVAEAEAIVAGDLFVFGSRVPLVDGVPDWFTDPLTGRRSDPERYAFEIDHRDEDAVGNVKYVWEAARHQYLPRLAAAWRLTGDVRFAERAARDLDDFWKTNPFLKGIHWTSGIEIGIRLISWVWTRRMLDGWPGVEALFEHNPLFLRQLRAHQDWLAKLPSHGSSANNHLIAEAAGAFVGAAAFPVFPESARRRDEAAEALAKALDRQTFADGLNRELATEYHAFVAELAMSALVEGEIQGRPFPDATWTVLAAIFDSAAALLDVAGRPPRQGDADEGLGLPLDPPSAEPERWASLLSVGDFLVGRQPWWPQTAMDVRSASIGAALSKRVTSGRPQTRPSLFPDGGLVILRDLAPRPDEIWARMDNGPHGYLAIAAHGHADALAIELRHGGVDVLADPGTYCYHGERRWRRYFRSTIGHNTLELAGVDQAVDGGPFLWLKVPTSRLLGAGGLDSGDVAEWRASHDGYRRIRPATEHERNVRLDRAARSVEITDRLVGGGHGARLAFHLGPDVSCTLDGRTALLRWTGPAGAWRARMTLPANLAWSEHRGESDPPLGWYSAGFGHKAPSTTLLGRGPVAAGETLQTQIAFEPDEPIPAEGPQ